MIAVGCTAALVTGAAGCGTVEQLSAGKKLSDASGELSERKSLSVELGLDATPKQLIALTEDESEPMPAEAAKLLSQARISLSVQSRKPLKDSAAKDVTGTRFRIGTKDGDLAEYRLIGDDAYYRADLQRFGKLSGVPVPTAGEMKGDAPKGAEFLEKVLAGEWIKIDTKEMGKLTSGLGAPGAGGGPGMGGGPGAKASKPAPQPSLSAKTQQRVVEAIKGVVADEVTVKDGGSRDGADHLVATARFRTLLTSVVDALRPIAAEFPPGTELPKAKDLADAPDKKIAVDFALKDGKLAGASTDLARLDDDPATKNVLLGLEFGDAKPVSAPAGATEVTAEELLKGVGSMMLGGMMGQGMGDDTAGDASFGESSGKSSFEESSLGQ
ncbi:hypothetical protein [Streptomyces sp. H27-D2]|uniref:hypothetical protein n=1 Tax=Streptomyces sp. H27-D2 TaxID=3046304 RepID=UPI002DBA903F|nr:hypothetical protein [Streptomyces sp. H27-D2]MEC4018878.1 hypothetical protein [Streptomyces sp. H27-D2]